MGSKQRRIWYALPIIGAVLSVGPLQAAGVEVVVATGEPSPNGNGTLSQFSAPVINNAGQLAFTSLLTATAAGTADNRALYRTDPGGLTEVIRKGVSTLNGMTVSEFFPASPWLDADGTVVSVVAVGPLPGQLQYAIGDGGPLTAQYPPGSPNPSGTHTLLTVTSSTVNDAGDSVYSALYLGSPAETGVYRRAADGTLSAMLLRNATAPRGGTITGAGGKSAINESAHVATIATINAGASIMSAMRIDDAGVHELARQGDIAVDGVTTLGSITSTAHLNNAGQVAFAANYTQSGQSRLGVLRADDSGLKLMAPGVLPGTMSLTSEVGVIGVSDSGSVAFTAEFFGGFDPPAALYVADDGGPALVAMEGTQTPGGKFFRRLLSGGVTVNESGQLAFQAELSDVAGGPLTGYGLYFYDPQSGLAQITRTGDSLMGGIIASNGLFFWGSSQSSSLHGPDRSLSGLNSAGQVAFGFLLDDSRSGVAVWSAPSATATGDFDEDGDVDGDDLARWLGDFGVNNLSDADDDGDSDGADFLAWQQQLGSGVPATAAAAAVPEPAPLALISLAGCGLALVLQQRR
jgi:hypothetical protein